MKWLIPDSIAGRTGLVLLVGLMATHVLSLAFYFTDRADALTTAGEEHVGERIATIVQIIENAPETKRQRVLSYVKSPSMRVELSTKNSVPENTEGNWRPNVLWKSLRAHLEGLDARKFTIRYVDDQGEDKWRTGPLIRGEYGKSISASVQLLSGDWLNFAAAVEAPEPFWSVRFILSVIVMIAAVLILSTVVVHYLVEPLRVFSRAAERLGVDIHAPSLQETGPREVRHATRAFNEMQKKISKLNDDRMRMLAAISHDLRTPITRLRLRADFIEDEEQSGKALRDLDEMEAMISSLLSYARDDASEESREIVDLVTLLQSVCDDMADMGHEVTFSGKMGRLPYSCSRLAMRRAFTNLLENGIRYGDRVRVYVSKIGDRVFVHIDDDGPGISDAEKEKAFDAFYRIEQSRNRETGGAGVGLYVARAIVRGHGGEINITNRNEGGLRVEVVLPC